MSDGFYRAMQKKATDRQKVRDADKAFGGSKERMEAMYGDNRLRPIFEGQGADETSNGRGPETKVKGD